MSFSSALKTFILFFSISAYVLTFIHEEGKPRALNLRLESPPPLPIQQFLSGYNQQLAAEFTYIGAAIYLGGSTSLKQHALFADSLTSRCFNMIHLHPYLIDPYYLCESSLSWLNAQYAQSASELLNFGSTFLTEEWVLPFFTGFNYFYFLEQPLKAAKFIRHASHIIGSPTWLPSLANTLTAKGGDLKTSLAWLKIMYANETEASAKLRYQSDIQSFEQAIKIQHALEKYRIDFNKMPLNLNQLVPYYIESVTLKEGRYDLQYDVEQHILRMQKNTKRLHPH